MLTKDFSFTLPNAQIARYPKEKRTDSRLLYLNRDTGKTFHNKFADLASFINKGDLLVLNTSRVLPARVWGKKETGGKVELLVERILSTNVAWVHIKASKAPKAGTWITLYSDVRLQVRKHDSKKGLFLVEFYHNSSIQEILQQVGEVPLPPYMERLVTEEDKSRYQTVYAEQPGSVAAPTAGLHFDDLILQDLESKGVEIGKLILHVGAGTFKPVRSKYIHEHRMHTEQILVPQKLCDQITTTKARGGRIICVGTTCVRSLESAALNGNLQPISGETGIFITPGFKFKIVDGIITNFHLPESTLLMLVCAFAGQDKVLAAYQQAINNNYRFYSYGDAMLLA